MYFEGTLNYYIEYEYDANGFRIRATDTWPDGDVFGIRTFTYNELGLTETVTYSFPDGEVYLTDVFEYDANGLVQKISGFGGNGNISYVLNYVDGVLVSEEIYDENGNLIEVIDYSGSGKTSKIIKADRLDGKFNLSSEQRFNADRNPEKSKYLISTKKNNRRSEPDHLQSNKLPSQVSSKVQRIRLHQNQAN